MPACAAILVLNFNGKSQLDTCLASVLAEARPNDHVYVVDNGSVDGSVAYVEENYPSVRIIKFGRNLGFAQAYNLAIEQVDDEYVVFLNNDVEVAQNWLCELIEPLQKDQNERVVACGSKLLFYWDRKTVNHAGGRLMPLGGGVDLGFLEPDTDKPVEPQFVGCVSAASMAVRRLAFIELGGFDTDFFAYFEDVDFCWRAWLAGYQVLLVPQSRVYHKGSATWGPLLTSQRVYLGERNRLQCIMKNAEADNAILGIVPSFAFSLARVLQFLMLGLPSNVVATIRAHWWIVNHVPRILAKRRVVQRRRTIPDAFLTKHRLMASFLEALSEYKRLALLSREYPHIFGFVNRKRKH